MRYLEVISHRRISTKQSQKESQKVYSVKIICTKIHAKKQNSLWIFVLDPMTRTHQFKNCSAKLTKQNATFAEFFKQRIILYVVNVWEL